MYRTIMKLDLQTDKKKMLIVNGLALGIAVVAVIVGLTAVPFSSVISLNGIGVFLAKAGVMIFGSIAYIFGHELIHGLLMKRYSGVKVRYGFTGIYAYAGSDAYFCKRDYLVIAFAPVVLWGIFIGVLCILLPSSWFWVLYFIEILNLSGAAGDIYVGFVLAKMPREILVRDAGVAMEIYAPDHDK